MYWSYTIKASLDKYVNRKIEKGNRKKLRNTQRKWEYEQNKTKKIFQISRGKIIQQTLLNNTNRLHKNKAGTIWTKIKCVLHTCDKLILDGSRKPWNGDGMRRKHGGNV